MEKSIQFRGIALDRSDQLAQDGELAFCEGAEVKDGTLRPAVINRTALGTVQGELLYVHGANGYTHYICRDGGSLRYYAGTDSGIAASSGDVPAGEIAVSALTHECFGSLGNTIIITSPGQGMYYIVWRPGESPQCYQYLGQQPPMIEIEFHPGNRPSKPGYEMGDSLKLVCRNSDDKEIACQDGTGEDSIPYAFYRIGTSQAPGIYLTLDANEVSTEGEEDDVYISNYSESARKGPDVYIRSDYRSLFTESLWALINKTNSHIASEGRFYAPFFVRYAYRMFDGSTFMCSAPVLVAADLEELGQVTLCNQYKDGDAYRIDGNYMRKYIYEISSSSGLGHYYSVENVDGATGHFLCYKPVDFPLQYIISSKNVAELKKWGDVIQSVDVFISAPLTWYDDTRLLEKFTYNNDGVSLPQYVNYGGDGEDSANVFYKFDNGAQFMLYYLHAMIPRTYPDGKDKRFSSTSAFYLLKSISLSDLPESGSSARTFSDDSSVIANITTREQMKDEYNGHSCYIASGQYLYNRRLHVFGVWRRLFPGFPVNTLLEVWRGGISVTSVAVRLALDSGSVWVTCTCGSTWSYSETLLRAVPMFYPDTRATMMQLTVSGGSYIVFDMTEHDELDGSITTPSSYRVAYTSAATTGTDASLIVPVADSLLVSDAGNPFIFPAENVSTIGNGKVLGLCTATRALSEGQYGSFPLMAFCTDGIWALSVTSAGTYSAVNPVSREVAAYTVSTDATTGMTTYLARSILQMDQSVMFSTGRGLCLLSGSEVITVSGALEGQRLDVQALAAKVGNLASLKALYPGLACLACPLTDIPVVNGSMDFRPLYDYAGHRLILFPEGFLSAGGKSSPCLLISEKDARFSTLHLTGGSLVRTVLNAYPYPYLQTTDGTIHRLDGGTDYMDHTYYSYAIVTRHMSMGGYRDAITAIRHERDFDMVPLLLLFGSDDGVTDHYIGSISRDHASYLPGHPFRYFRIVMAVTSRQYERYTALILGVTRKHGKL